MSRTLGICILVLTLFVTCKKKDNKQATYTPSCSGTKSFASDVLPLIKAECWRCHNNLNDYSQIKALTSSIKTNVESATMPKDKQLSDAQKDIIICWIEAGAPNN